MAYVGRGIDNISNASLLDAITFTNSAGPYNLTKGSAAFTPVSVQALVISVDGVIQAPDSYTISAATITFGESMASSLTNDFIVHNGVGLITEPSDGSVTTAKIEDLAVTSGKLAADSVITAKILDDNVTTGKILDSNITYAKIQDTTTANRVIGAATAGVVSEVQVVDDMTNFVSTSSAAGLTIKGDGTTDGYVALNCDQNTHAIKLKSPPHSAAQTYTLTFPITAPATDKYLQTTSGGQLSFATVSEYNDAGVRSDIMTLALKQATQENMTKHNLPNSAVVAFQADADFDLAGSTDIARNASEYISSVSTVVGAFTSDSDTVLLLHMDGADGGTTFTDSSSNAHTVTLDGDVHTDTTVKKFGTASAQFDSSGDALLLGTNSQWDFTSSVGTLEAWLYPTTSSESRWITIGNAVSKWGSIVHNGGGTEYQDQRWGVTGIITSGASITNDTWQHIAIVREAGGDEVIYCNGVEKGSGSQLFTSGDLVIGKQKSNYFEGYIDEVRISSVERYSGTFTPNEVTGVNATGTALGTTNVPSSAVSEVSGVFLLKNAFGTNILGTDVKVYFTADNSNWTEASSYTSAGTFSTGITQIALGKTTVTEGSDVRWKIVFANQVADTKVAEIYGIGTNY